MASDIIARGMANSAQKKADSAYDLAAGRAKNLSVSNIQTLVATLNIASSDYAKVGDNIYVQTLNVPDFWVYQVSGTKVIYSYTTDAAFTQAIARYGSVQVGYFLISQLESKHQITFGYYYNGYFYYNSTHTDQIIPDENCIFIDIPTKDGYIYRDGNYTQYTHLLLIGESATDAFAGNRGVALEQGLATEIETRTQAIATEKSQREQADAELDGKITAEAQARTQADSALQAGLNAEIVNRTTAVSNEAIARADADTALGVRIDNETSARATADTALGERINAEETARENADTAEKNAREAADASEKAQREAADAQLASDLAAETTRATGAEGALDTKIDGEIARASAAENALDGRVTTIESKIPSQAASDNQLADKEFVNSSINNLAAYYITKNAAGDPFSTKAELNAASTFYSGGAARVPTRNDYTIVLADESKTSATGSSPSTRYHYNNGVWEFQYIINNTPLTAAQLAALNSGVTSTNMSALLDHLAATNNPHGVTKAQVGLGNVDNTADLDKPISTATQSALTALEGIVAEKIQSISLPDGTVLTVINGAVTLPEYEYIPIKRLL